MSDLNRNPPPSGTAAPLAAEPGSAPAVGAPGASASRRLIGRILLVPAIALGAVLAWQAPQAFALTGLFQGLANQFLGAQIDSRYAGGPVMAKLRDRAGDDSGAGQLAYPLHDSFQTGHVLDLLAYTVHQPQVSNLPFMPDQAFWQLDFTLGELGPAVIHDYIDLDGAASGSTESAEAGNEGVDFDPAHPWDLFIEVDVLRGTAFMQESAGGPSTPLSVYRNKERKTLMVRVPLDRPLTKSMLAGGPSWHCVMVGAWDEYARGHFMPIAAKANLRTAGGSASPQTPRVFDILCPEGQSQTAILSSFDEAGGTPARLPAVEIRPGQAAAAGLAEKQLAALADQAKAEQEAYAASALTAARAALASETANPPPSLERAMNLWITGQDKAAEEIYDRLLRDNPDNLVARAHKGTLISSRCLTAKSLDETIAYVNQAFVQLEAAVAAAEALDLASPSALPWEAFGDLCLNIPEVPFGRSRQGAQAFLQAARWHENAARRDPAATNERAALARAYLLAGQCFEMALANGEAETCFMQASSVKEADSQTRLELAKRGFF